MTVAVTQACPDSSAIDEVGGRLHCSRCESEVLDLRYVTEREAKAMIARETERRGRVCRRMFTDAEGRPSFLVEPAPRRGLPVLPMAFAATIASACATEAPRPAPPAPVVAAAPNSERATPDVAAPVVDVASGADAGTHENVATAAAVVPDASVSDASEGSHARGRSRSRRTRPAGFLLEGF